MIEDKEVLGADPALVSDRAQEVSALTGFDPGERAWTPGPWHVAEGGGYEYNDEELPCVRVESSSWIVALALADASPLAKQAPHNAALIAAAPCLYEALAKARDLIIRGDFAEGYCCCGDPVEGHNIGSGHSPVDAGDYHAGQILAEIDAALAKATPLPEAERG